MGSLAVMFFLIKYNEIDILSKFLITCGSSALSRSISFAARFRLVMVNLQARSRDMSFPNKRKIGQVSRVEPVDPLAILVLPPLTCLYHPGLYSRQQVSLFLTIKLSLTALLYSRDRCCSVQLASPHPQNLSPSKNVSHNSFQVK